MSAVLRIDYACSQYGNPVVLIETDRLLVCRFCKVRLYLYSEEPLRSYFPERAPQGCNVFYTPYVRLRGMEFVCATHKVCFRVVDTTRNATSYSMLPDSFGLQPQALHLRFLPDMSPQRLSAPSQLIKQRAGISSSRPGQRDDMFTRYVAETFSLIYALFFYVQEGELYDALLNRVCGPGCTPDFAPPHTRGGICHFCLPSARDAAGRWRAIEKVV